MKALMSSNLYEFKGDVVVCGSCLPYIHEEAFEKVKQLSKNIFFVCLEEIHMNMVAHKIASILRTGNVKRLFFVTVDRSPHCVQLHYIRLELAKIMNLENVVLKNYVVKDENLVEIPPEVISLSKNLHKIKELRSKS